MSLASHVAVMADVLQKQPGLNLVYASLLHASAWLFYSLQYVHCLL